MLFIYNRCPFIIKIFLFLIVSTIGFISDYYSTAKLTFVYLIIIVFGGLLFNKLWLSVLICVFCTLFRDFITNSGISHIHITIAQYAAYQLIFSLLIKFRKEIMHRKKMELKYRDIAYHDTLTGLRNRLSFLETLDKVIHKSDGKIAIYLLDLVRFKLINDTLGHDIGDVLLKNVAKRLIDCLEEHGLVFRLAGDEFTIISKINDITDAQSLAMKIIKQFENPFLINGDQYYISTSIGISLYPTDGIDKEKLMKCADVAMYSAKEHGNNIYRFYSADRKYEEEFLIENAFRKALDEKQFIVYFQPKFNLENNKLSGLEALIRWDHPQFGIIQPNKFIPIAEKTGLIIPLGEHVLNMVCNQINTWQKKGVHVPKIAINLSAEQFKQDNIVTMVKDTLEINEVNSNLIEIEITESAIINNENEVIFKIQQLKDLCITVSIDDFGTGYSSLSYLKSIPFDELKIDQCFIRDLGNKRNNAIVKAIISLANHLELRVCAEGVENLEQLNFLRKNGCHTIQGFIISKPLTTDEVYDQFLSDSLMKFSNNIPTNHDLSFTNPT